MRKSNRSFQSNITKRGLVAAPKEKSGGYKAGPIVLGLLIFVVCGSAVFQILQSIRTQQPGDL